MPTVITGRCVPGTLWAEHDGNGATAEPWVTESVLGQAVRTRALRVFSKTRAGAAFGRHGAVGSRPAMLGPAQPLAHVHGLTGVPSLESWLPSEERRASGRLHRDHPAEKDCLSPPSPRAGGPALATVDRP